MMTNDVMKHGCVCVSDTKKTVESVQVSELDINWFYSDIQREI